MKTKYGKLIGGEITFYKLPIKTETQDIYTNDPEILLEYGYKEVIFTDAPEVEEGYYVEPNWNETETQIIQTWEIKPIEPEEESEEE